jgi:hypothetical protein
MRSADNTRKMNSAELDEQNNRVGIASHDTLDAKAARDICLGGQLIEEEWSLKKSKEHNRV